MNKKHLVLPGVLAVAAAVVAAVNLWPTELEKLREQNLCLGMLTERTAGLLQDGKGGAVMVEEFVPKGSGSETGPADPVFATTCFVNRGNADDKSSMRLQYTLDVTSTNTLDDPPKDAAPLGDGLRGWVGPRQSEAQLPDGCAKEMRRPDARYIAVTLKISPVAISGQDWNYASLMNDSRTVITEAVENLTKQYDCAA
ncbi:hypothetical protein OG543_08125 [Streptomyces sp. NBC_01178]|uniref:hypothetical protein n=1 Tax=Streptomyces sp. NBC_01178 TaxID=2903762 RepID=UPI00386A971D|nr:hypothetical protein OG543_08125 [Streptomyces sp. NBC_01178]